MKYKYCHISPRMWQQALLSSGRNDGYINTWTVTNGYLEGIMYLFPVNFTYNNQLIEDYMGRRKLKQS